MTISHEEGVLEMCSELTVPKQTLYAEFFLKEVRWLDSCFSSLSWGKTFMWDMPLSDSATQVLFYTNRSDCPTGTSTEKQVV